MVSRNADDGLRSTPRGERSALKIEVHADAAAASRRAAAWIAEAAVQAIEQRNRFVLALSGGSTPRQMLRILAAEAIDWRKVHLIQVDERVAPLGSPERNLTQLRDALLVHIPLPEGQIEPMPVENTDLAAAAKRYGRLLVRLAGSPALLDLVQLGLGADGHTASLVPGDAALEVSRADVAVTAPYNGWRRMTLTLPIINRARRILWLVTGADKAEAVARLVQGDPSLLASRISRESALLLVDRAAVALLASHGTI
ncbi:MAG: 6-phosphogluconolactonase [Rhodocyclaceae bacterium]|nr:6-phosphogluconolactonase [Rhodocyclaceae bacterium]